MWQTLFTIPPSVFQGPLLVLWLIGCAVVLFLAWRKQGFGSEFYSFLPVVIVGLAVIGFVLPSVQVAGVNPDDPLGPKINSGLAVRGYGLFMLVAVVSGTGLVLSRCRAIGQNPEQIYTLAAWMVASGIIGARLFFVIQNHDRFFGSGQPLGRTLFSVVNMTEGGLVVYGSLIGASLAAFAFFWKTRLPLWRTADLIAPGMALGLAIGRIGCLMNGCCWGGVCEAPLPAISFPAGSPPFMQHLYQGRLLGLTTTDEGDGGLTVTAVGPGIGQELGIRTGDQIAIGSPDPQRIQYLIAHDSEAARDVMIPIDSARQGRLQVPLSRLTPQSRPVHPTQIYSSINAAVLCLFLWFYWYYRRADGEVFGMMLVIYPIGRFIIEMIRNDEHGQFGTAWTISQWVSIVSIIVGLAIIGHARFHHSFARPANGSLAP